MVAPSALSWIPCETTVLFTIKNTWEYADRRIVSGKGKVPCRKKRFEGQYLLTGLIRCPERGSAMSRQSHSQQDEGWYHQGDSYVLLWKLAPVAREAPSVTPIASVSWKQKRQ